MFFLPCKTVFFKNDKKSLRKGLNIRKKTYLRGLKILTR